MRARVGTPIHKEAQRRVPADAESTPQHPGALRALQSRIAACTLCPSMTPWRQFRPDVYGARSTGYLLVGEAPGHVSLVKGRRFTGPAGLLIRRALRSVGHPRYRDLEDLFYMTDVVKCHPAAAANPASNRSPRQTEIRACSGYLVHEIQVLQPSAIITFGKTAAAQVTSALATVSLTPVPRLIAFPHPSPRNQVTIRKHYASMQAFERDIAATFRRLIARLEQSRHGSTWLAAGASR